jgi:hypothetical protein
MEYFNKPETNLWRNGYFFALVLLLVFGVSLIIIGTAVFQQGSLPNVILVGSGISMAPAAIVAALFRVFLFREVQYQLTYPIIDEVRKRLGPEIKAEINSLIEKYRNEMISLQAIIQAGIICPYRRRELALKEFATAIDSEESEIMIIGSSLKGLLQMDKYKEISDKLKFKITSGNVNVKFLLTHPVVADLRAGQEARQNTDIGKEIISSLRILKDWGVPHENVRLYKGTPTIFAIKTGEKMFLNPYPYGSVAYDSPSLIIGTLDQNSSYFFDAFDAAHFGAWDTNAVEKIYNYDQTISNLENKLEAYSKLVNQLLTS